MRILITGGIKSGKSRQALVEASAFSAPRYFLTTAEAFDEEMAARIRRHKADRGDAFVTIEEPLAIEEKLRENMVLDCVTLWLNNMFFYGKEKDIPTAVDRIIDRLPRSIVIVTNEVGGGLVPADILSRKYVDALGTTNARLAAACERVVLMVAGIPVTVANR